MYQEINQKKYRVEAVERQEARAQTIRQKTAKALEEQRRLDEFIAHFEDNLPPPKPWSSTQAHPCSYPSS